MSRDAAISDLVAQIYQSVSETDNWSRVLAQLAALFDGHAAFTMMVGAGAHDQGGLFAYNLPLDAFVDYGEHYYLHDLWSPVWLAEGFHLTGQTCTDKQLVNQREFARSVWFNEYLRPLDIAHSLFGPLTADTKSPMMLAIDRPINAEPFSYADMEHLRPLLGHFAKALTLWRQFQDLKEATQAQQQALDTWQRGLISITTTGRVLYANNLALNLLRQQDLLTVKNGLLGAVTEVGRRALNHALTAAKHGIGHVFSLARPLPAPPLIIQSVPLPDDKAALELPVESHSPKILLILSGFATVPLNAYTNFAKIYGLTRQETNTLQELVDGKTLKEIAENRQVSFNTVRSQTASLLQKTGCKRQKDVVALFLSTKL